MRLIRNGLRPVSGAGQTRNLSSGGVLFASDVKIDPGEAVEYIIDLEESGRINLHCLGKVIRLDADGREDPERPFQMAATMERYEFIRKR